MNRTPEQIKSRLDEILGARPEIVPVIMDVVIELLTAESKHASWPDDAVHASAILNEEAGELTQAVLDFHYADGMGNDFWAAKSHMHDEAVQCGAMSLRFLLHMDLYKAPVRKSS